MRNEIQSKVEEAMNSLDGMQKAEALPYLWSKITARLEQAVTMLPLQPVWRVATTLVIIVTINIITIFSGGNTPIKKQTGTQLVGEEYSLTLTQLY